MVICEPDDILGLVRAIYQQIAEGGLSEDSAVALSGMVELFIAIKTPNDEQAIAKTGTLPIFTRPKPRKIGFNQ